MNRRQRYRELMRTLDPSGDPRMALQQGWGVERPASATAESIARRIEIEPWSSHLLVGGIGSGKTTELWRIHQRLKESEDESGDTSFYIDVATKLKLDQLWSGEIVALVFRRLIAFERHVRKARGGGDPDIDVVEAVSNFHVFENQEFNWDGNYEDCIFDMIQHLRVMQRHTTTESGHCVFLFDSLDRLTDMKRLEHSLRYDIQALKEARIGTVVVGPMRLQHGSFPQFADLFDQNVHPLADVNPVSDGLAFLVEVLTRRAASDVVPPEACVEIARASGGVLRDLIALAKSSAQEAYIAGSDVVSSSHVAKGAEKFGRVRAVGLDSEQIKVLKKVRENGTLVIRGERELALLETRRVLDYGNGQFVVHPTLAPLLDFITVAA